MTIEIPRVAWLHSHLRQMPGCEVANEANMADLIDAVLRVSGVVLPMPNTRPSLQYPEQAIAYAAQIQEFWARGGYPGVLDVVRTLKLVQTDEYVTRPVDVDAAADLGIFDWKLMPRPTPKRHGGSGANVPMSSTNTEDGVYDIYDFFSVFRRIAARGGRLHWHLENADEPNLMDREFRALHWLDDVASQFPQLCVVVEHVSDRRTFEVVDRHSNIWVGVTAHHLTGTYEDVPCDPHAKCAPIMKTDADQSVLLDRAVHDPKCYFTPDEAPHHRRKKENLPEGKEAANGCYTAPCAISLVATQFESVSALHKLPEFLTHRGRRLHGLSKEMRMIVLEKRPFVVPLVCAGDIVPYKAGETLPWTVVS